MTVKVQLAMRADVHAGALGAARISVYPDWQEPRVHVLPLPVPWTSWYVPCACACLGAALCGQRLPYQGLLINGGRGRGRGGGGDLTIPTTQAEPPTHPKPKKNSSGKS